MGKPTGFKEFDRKKVPWRLPVVRINDYDEIYTEPRVEQLQEQGARCMDCGVPFCQSTTGCPIDNLIPEWNDLVYNNRWKEAIERLHKTNNFPGIHRSHLPRALRRLVRAGDHQSAGHDQEHRKRDRRSGLGGRLDSSRRRPKSRTGKKVAIVGSGPAGLVCRRSTELSRPRSHRLRTGRSNRRTAAVRHSQHEAVQGSGPASGRQNDGRRRQVHDRASMLARTSIPSNCKQTSTRCCWPAVRPSLVILPIANRDAKGVHFAMEFLTANTKQTRSRRFTRR